MNKMADSIIKNLKTLIEKYESKAADKIKEKNNLEPEETGNEYGQYEEDMGYLFEVAILTNEANILNKVASDLRNVIVDNILKELGGTNE